MIIDPTCQSQTTNNDIKKSLRVGTWMWNVWNKMSLIIGIGKVLNCWCIFSSQCINDLIRNYLLLCEQKAFNYWCIWVSLCINNRKTFGRHVWTLLINATNIWWIHCGKFTVENDYNIRGHKLRRSGWSVPCYLTTHLRVIWLPAHPT